MRVEGMENEGGMEDGMQKEKEGGMGKNGFVLSGIRSLKVVSPLVDIEGSRT